MGKTMAYTPTCIYIYRTSTGSVSVPANVEIGIVKSLDARLRQKALSLKSFRGGRALTKEIRSGCTELLSPFHSSGKTLPRRSVLFGKVNEGKILQRRRVELLGAVESLIRQMEEYGDDLAIEYGIFVNERDPVMQLVPPELYERPPSAHYVEVSIPNLGSDFYTSVRFADDPHPYTFWSSFGVLDRIKHDSQTLVEIERTDIRSCKETLYPVNAGEIRFFHKNHDLTLLRTRLKKLCDLLKAASDEIVEMMPVPSGAQKVQREQLFGMTLEQMGMWSDPGE
jgi:hypothetical protein